MVDLVIEPVLHDVQTTGNVFGEGIFAVVEEAEVHGTMCAVKCVSDPVYIPRFECECKMLSKLRHPHIVAYLGTTNLHDSLILVMEKLPYTLHNILNCYKQIPLGLQHSILSDVARGLIYLHTHSIIHCDITARNVCLTSGLEAKIVNFTTAKNLSQSEPMEYTQYPGTMLYMPPEAEGKTYGTSLDIFSFGVVALFIMTQDDPFYIEPRVVTDQNGELILRSEVERREKYFAQLDRENPVVKITQQCLADDSQKRPTAEMILETIKSHGVSAHEQSRAKIKTLEMIIRNQDSEVTKELTKDSPMTRRLKPYTRKAKPTGKELGRGTYGIVLEMESHGATLAGKVFKHDMLSQIEEMLTTEIVLMATFQHPHLVQFVGVCFLPDQSNFPVLLMEKMMTNLHTYLKDPQNQKLPFVKKVMILRDVARGLSYLHERRPALIHRDLKPKNVLLTAELTAKIGDLGTGKIVDLDPEATPYTHTTLPGTAEYMAPEATDGHAKYDTKIDIFAFGHLALFTIVQTPILLLPATYTDEEGLLHPRSEVRRRQKSIDIASESLGKQHPLVVLLKQCLHNLSGNRPCANEILEKFKKIISDMQQKAQEDSQKPQNESTHKEEVEVSLAKLRLMKLPSGEPIKIIETVAKDWRKVGNQLNFDRVGSQLAVIENQKPNNPVLCCEAMFQHWLNGNGVTPVTWKKLIEILNDCEFISLADQVETALKH